MKFYVTPMLLIAAMSLAGCAEVVGIVTSGDVRYWTEGSASISSRRKAETAASPSVVSSPSSVEQNKPVETAIASSPLPASSPVPSSPSVLPSPSAELKGFFDLREGVVWNYHSENAYQGEIEFALKSERARVGMFDKKYVYFSGAVSRVAFNGYVIDEKEGTISGGTVSIFTPDGKLERPKESVDGFIRWVMRPDMKVGSEWSYLKHKNISDSTEGLKAKARVDRVEDLCTPAGLVKNCYVITETLTDPARAGEVFEGDKLWVAKDIGIVKFIAVGGTKVTTVLTGYNNPHRNDIVLSKCAN